MLNNFDICRLPSKQPLNPKEVLDCFFRVYDVSTAKQYISICVELALTTDNDMFDTAIDRANLVHFTHFIEDLLEAASLLQKAE